ncbi:flagellar type III secretion system pore protein FliP [Sansalvadorimonas sp. 2012CJ34-2]|uniref:Flagellar biosynthetic protein FliP n=1 Tax=Parendozoicomonas callyspongiae TaxID=2942213 RepID=A0ABT0PEA4_9GAMM|nr:flagellar type III secretion system pore protein FliP [Sansalvadorimonas sp. 2012CJ34-2]MCL6269536.1 flagellar type III secretion system pore protein FliP [Sansalvadorimonas sp. 2012CJ34-2]
MSFGLQGQIPFLTVSSGGATQDYSISLQILLLLTALTFLPTALMAMTSFTRILIVLAILRQALGLQQTPPTRLLIGLALILTLFIMRPIFEEIRTKAVEPYLNEQIAFQDAARETIAPLHRFMLSQTRKTDLEQFFVLSGEPQPQSQADIPITTLMPAFLTSELKTAFQIGFMIFLPFLVIDLIIASILMALGMMMLSPLIISLPFKLMLFVLVDGWGMTVGSLARSF